MKSGLTVFALGVAGIAAAAAMVAPPPAEAPAEAPAANQAAEAVSPPIKATDVKPPYVAPPPRVMVSHSTSGPAISVPGTGRPPPPIVAIPRIPGPADMTIIGDRPGDVVTIRSFPSNEACDEALPAARRRYSDAVCISTTPPPPPPEYGFLFEVRMEDNEMVALETYPSMAACRQALAARPAKPGHQAGCSPKFH